VWPPADAPVYPCCVLRPPSGSPAPLHRPRNVTRQADWGRARRVAAVQKVTPTGARNEPCVNKRHALRHEDFPSSAGH
jgi:hypothetical protein